MPEAELTDLPGVLSFVPKRHGDTRGYFSETYNEMSFTDIVGQSVKFVQDNESLSVAAGTVRGLHYQTTMYAQGKLVRVTSGKLLDVCVDIRTSSKTFGNHITIELDASEGKQLWVPPGFAHGFCTLEPNTTISYKVTDFYNSDADRSIKWNDPDLGIQWPSIADESQLSAKDASASLLSQLREAGDLFA